MIGDRRLPELRMMRGPFQTLAYLQNGVLLVTMTTKAWAGKQKRLGARTLEKKLRIAMREVTVSVPKRNGAESVTLAEWYDPVGGKVLGYTAPPWIYRILKDSKGHESLLLSTTCEAGNRRGVRTRVEMK